MSAPIRILLAAPILLLAVALDDAHADKKTEQGIVITIEPDEPPAEPEEPERLDEIERREAARRDRARDRPRSRGERGRNLVVGEADVVDEAVVIGGNLTVRGQVDQDVVVILGRLKVEDGAQIGGDAVVIGGRLDVESGGYIEGDRVEMGFFGSPLVLSSWGESWSGRRSRVMGLVGTFLTLIVVLLLGWLAHALAGRRLVIMSKRLRTDTFRSFVAGFLTFLLWVPAMILCAITLIGIPIAALLGVLLPLAAFVGFLAGSHAIGQRIGGGVRFERQGDLGFLLLGVTAIGVLSLLGATLNLMGQPLFLVATGFKAAGFIVASLISMVGLGALVISRFGRQVEPVTTPVLSDTATASPVASPPPSPPPAQPPSDPSPPAGP